MKKKIVILALCLAVLMALFCSCDLSQLRGENGLSAYEIAVKNGFEGTEEEWLNSLKGETVFIPTQMESESSSNTESESTSSSETESSESESSESEHVCTTVIDQSTTINQNITQEITKNEITVEGESIDVTNAVQKGLMSAVSVHCEFMTGGSSPFNGAEVYGTAGSGVVYKINDDGSMLVITNFHVVYDVDSTTKNKISDRISIYLYGMEYVDHEMDAVYVGGSMNYDIAVLYIPKNDRLDKAIDRGVVCEAEFAKGEVTIGETVLAIGNPEDDGISATSGIVSVDSESLAMVGADGVTNVEFRVIRTEAPINGGNSGGGLYNAKGQLVGIVNAKIVSTDVDNIGYAIPVSVVKAVVENIIHYCYETENENVMRPLLGVSVLLEEKWVELDPVTGLLTKKEHCTISSVSEGSLAYGNGEDGMMVGDVVTKIKVRDNEYTVTRQHHVIDAVLSAFIGDTVEITVLRQVEGQEKEITLSFVITNECVVAYK